MKWLAQQLESLTHRGLRRRLIPLGRGGAWVEWDGRRLLNLASNDYLGLCSDVRVVRAACQAIEEWGVGGGSARLLAGHRAVHDRLEQLLAEFKGSEAALVFSSGYAAGVGLISGLAGPRDQVFADVLNHACLNDGARLSGATFRYYRHRDMEQLEKLLRSRAPSPRARRFIVTDAIFSMDGTIAPLLHLVELADRYDATLIVDDAHGTGVVGPRGRGTAHLLGVAGKIDVQMVTLSKALGSQGGAVVGSQLLIDYLLHRARPFVYSTALAPALAAAALTALQIVQSEEGEQRRHQQQANVLYVVEALRQKGYLVTHEAPAPMLAVIVGTPQRALYLSELLKSKGIYAPAIRPPTVPEGTSRLRLSPTALHTLQDMEEVVAAFPPAQQLMRDGR